MAVLRYTTKGAGDFILFVRCSSPRTLGWVPYSTVNSGRVAINSRFLLRNKVQHWANNHTDQPLLPHSLPTLSRRGGASNGNWTHIYCMASSYNNHYTIPAFNKSYISNHSMPIWSSQGHLCKTLVSEVGVEPTNLWFFRPALWPRIWATQTYNPVCLPDTG